MVYGGFLQIFTILENNHIPRLKRQINRKLSTYRSPKNDAFLRFFGKKADTSQPSTATCDPQASQASASATSPRHLAHMTRQDESAAIQLCPRQNPKTINGTWAEAKKGRQKRKRGTTQDEKEKSQIWELNRRISAMDNKQTIWQTVISEHSKHKLTDPFYPRRNKIWEHT